MRIRHWAAGLIALVLVFLVVSAPARLLGLLLAEQQVVARGFHGGLWSGTADDVAVAVNGGYLQLGRVQWTLSPGSLLLLSPRLQIESERGRQYLNGDITLSPGGAVRLRETEIRMDAAIARRFMPVELGGDITVLASDLTIEDAQAAEGSARIVWQGARWLSGLGPQPLGDYVAELEVVEAGQLGAKISTLSGPIEANGNASLFGRALTIDVRLTSEQPFHPSLAEALQLVAAPTDNGYHLKMNLDI